MLYYIGLGCVVSAFGALAGCVASSRLGFEVSVTVLILVGAAIATPLLLKCKYKIRGYRRVVIEAPIDPLTKEWYWKRR